jgi:hypothetical protein
MPTKTADREQTGKGARARVPLESQAEFRPAPGRDPVGLLIEQGRSRIPELVPVRHGRMLVSPFTFSPPWPRRPRTAGWRPAPGCDRPYPYDLHLGS